MTTEVAAAPLVRPWWIRARLWVGLAAVIALGGLLVGTLSSEPGRRLDPSSAHKDGSKALARLLDEYGASVTRTSSVRTAITQGAGTAVVVVAPDEYSNVQLGTLASAAARLVLVAPGSRAARAVAPGLEPSPGAFPDQFPFCSDRGASAAGRVSMPDDAMPYLPGRTGATICYGGVYLTTPRLAVVGSPALLQNANLADRGVAALAINAITDSRRLSSIVWLMPGADAAGSGKASLWDLFPAGTYRVFWTLVVLGLLIAIWRARRLGGVISEPLPVVVRSAEVVEGHGRLYARAGARDRAAAALRAAVTGRLAHRLGLPRGSSAEQVAVAVAPLVGGAPGELVALLAGPPPADDVALLRLAHDLDGLEAALGGATEGMRR
jgi:hypothetical protein